MRNSLDQRKKGNVSFWRRNESEMFQHSDMRLEPIEDVQPPFLFFWLDVLLFKLVFFFILIILIILIQVTSSI